MKRYQKAIFGLVSVVLALGIVTFGIWYSYEKSQRSNQKLRQETDAQSVTQNKIYISIKTDNDEKNYDVENQNEEISVFDLLKGLKENTDDFDFSYQEYDFGVMITSINGVTPDEEHFFKLVVNGQDAQKGVSDIKVKNGDKVEFVLTKIQ